MGAIKKIRDYLKFLGPGVITGASDDDPAGITTYSVTGASTGYSLIWLSLYTTPMLIAVQVMAAKIGLVTRRGLAAVIKDSYGRTVLIISVIVALVSNIATIGADLVGVAAAINLLIPKIAIATLVPIVAIFITITEIFFSYKQLRRYFKWILLILFSYVIAGFLAHPNWHEALYRTIVPPFLQPTKNRLAASVGFLGTTITPYLFFWQASEEVEEIEAQHERAIPESEFRARVYEVDLGFIFSNVLTFFIVLTTAATLNRAGITNIQTAAQAAQALRPLAGNADYLLFSIGLIAAGLVAIPVLAGSTAYVMAELFGWNEGLSKKVREAPGFYFTLAISIVAGIGVNLIKLGPIAILFYSQVLVGIITPVLLVVIMLVANNRKIMGDRVNGSILNILGVLTILAMAAAAILYIVLLFY